MKPTINQQEVFKEVAAQVSSWINTNDITSPTHGCDIENGFMILELDNVLSEDASDEICQAVNDLRLLIIKTVK